MRLPAEDGEKLDSDAPLRLVNRGAQPSGRLSAHPPSKAQTLDYWKTLQTYFDTLPSVLEELQPIAEKVARQNTISKSVTHVIMLVEQQDLSRRTWCLNGTLIHSFAFFQLSWFVITDNPNS